MSTVPTEATLTSKFYFQCFFLFFFKGAIGLHYSTVLPRKCTALLPLLRSVIQQCHMLYNTSVVDTNGRHLIYEWVQMLTKIFFKNQYFLIYFGCKEKEVCLTGAQQLLYKCQTVSVQGIASLFKEKLSMTARQSDGRFPQIQFLSTLRANSCSWS